MPRLSEHERSGAIGMLKAGVHVSDVARYHKWHLSTIQRVNQATGKVKDRQEWRPALRANLRRLGIDDIYIDDIRSGWLLLELGE